MNYYPFHIGDYASATRHLSWDEDMAYRRLLDIYYSSEKPLPADIRSINRLVLATTDAQRDAVETVLNEFFELSESGWINARADVEIDAMRDKQQKQREKANKRWDKQRAERGNATDMPRHTDEDAAASTNYADAMPPTPTPTPTPVSKPKGLDRGAKRGTALPGDFYPNENGTKYALERNLIVWEQVEAFTNHHQAKGSVFKDWQAAWRTWCDKAVQFGQRGKGASESFFERDQRSKADRIGQFTGQAPRPAGNVIDVTPTARRIGGAK